MLDILKSLLLMMDRQTKQNFYCKKNFEILCIFSNILSIVVVVLHSKPDLNIYDNMQKNILGNMLKDDWPTIWEKSSEIRNNSIKQDGTCPLKKER